VAISFSTGKYETVGSLAVSTLLIGGAIGIGWHSFELMMNVLQVTGVNETASAVVATAVDPISSPSVAPAVQELASISEHHHHGQTLNVNAAWFALASIIIKEWLYRASKLISRDDLLIAE
jgi:divalent metal cation (Fe/Co/Zn/Cd) transporter